ncbi:hypothetical protein J4474_02480 [Candidatus Pacearchaeota archaeon]|nr:hypothetical protein [Candidatus Pacearchaeota archaeon]
MNRALELKFRDVEEKEQEKLKATLSDLVITANALLEIKKIGNAIHVSPDTFGLPQYNFNPNANQRLIVYNSYGLILESNDQIFWFHDKPLKN